MPPCRDRPHWLTTSRPLRFWQPLGLPICGIGPGVRCGAQVSWAQVGCARRDVPAVGRAGLSRKRRWLAHTEDNIRYSRRRRKPKYWPAKQASNQQTRRRARCTHPAVVPVLDAELYCDGLNLVGGLDFSRSSRPSAAAEEEGGWNDPPVVSASRSHGSGDPAGDCSADLYGASGTTGFCDFGGRRGDKNTPGVLEPSSSRPNIGSV